MSVVKINMRIGGRSYPISIDSNDESRMRSLEKEINRKIQFFKTEYETIDHLDAVTMTLLTYANDLSDQQSPDETLIHESLDQIDSILSEALS